MGVQGLTSFIDANSHLLNDFKLCNTRIIIDGNNLYHFLYYNSAVLHQYAGDYDTFAKAVKHFFQVLQSCNVEPFLVFDGGYEADNRKLRTVLSRCKERIHLAGFLSHGGRGKILPILAEEVFLHVLQDLGVKYATCELEADDQIAALANLWHCPVLSNDSDFFIFDIPGGYIPLGYFDLHVYHGSKATNDENQKCLSVQIYFCDNLLKLFSLGKAYLPLIATLLGNDYIDKGVFNAFYSKEIFAGKAKVKRLPKQLSGQRFQKITGLLSWLRSRYTVKEALADVTSCFKKENASSIYQAICQSMACYELPSTDLKELFEEGCDNVPQSTIKSYNKSSLPFWFMREIRQNCLPVFLLNAVRLHRVLLLSQVENMQKPSAYLSALSLRQVIYGILLRNDTSSVCEDKRRGDEARSDCIEEYDREQKKLVCNVVKPVFTVPWYGNLPFLSDIPGLSKENRCELVYSALEVTTDMRLAVTNFSERIRFFLALLVFAVRKSTQRCTLAQLKAIIVCVIKVSLESTFSHCVCEVPLKEGEVQLARDNLKKFNSSPKDIAHNTELDIGCIHTYAQIQACFQAGVYLNRLLLRPFPTLNPAQFFNGSFIYNYCRELKSRANPDLYTAEMLGRSSPLTEVYNSWLTFICGSVDNDVFAPDEKRGIKKSKKRGKAKASASVMSSDDSDHIVDNPCEKGTRLEANCELSNRFGNLMIDDDSDG